MKIKWGEDLSSTTAPRIFGGITIISEGNKITAFQKGKKISKVIKGNLLKAYGAFSK